MMTPEEILAVQCIPFTNLLTCHEVRLKRLGFVQGYLYNQTTKHMDTSIKLGCIARDKITQFEGFVVGKVSYLTGCDQYLIQPRVQGGPDKFVESRWIDEARLVFISDGFSPEQFYPDVTTMTIGGRTFVESGKPGGDKLPDRK